MCIIAYRPENKTISTETLKTMFEGNPNGAGIVYAENGKLHIKKGFMTLGEFLEACSEVPVSSPCIYHCRIATHGSVRQGTCHPFPCSSDADLLNAPEVELRKGFAVAHNGIISDMDTKNDFSDTQAFIRDILAPLSKMRSLHSETLVPVIEKCIGYSRLAVMDTTGRVSIFGRGWTVDAGVFYSNTSYKPYKRIAYEPKWIWDKNRRAYVNSDGVSLAEYYGDYDDTNDNIQGVLATHGWGYGF